MSAKVTVLVGPARCGKSHELLAAYRDALRPTPAGGGFRRAVWVAPNARAATAIRQRLVAGDFRACLEPGVTTFDALADGVLSTLPNPPRPLSPALERALLRRDVDVALEKKDLVVLADAARRASFVQLLDEHFDELQRRGISPESFNKMAGMRGDRAQHTELALLYAEYARMLIAYRLGDMESRLAVAHEVLARDERAELLAGCQLVVVDGFTDFSVVQHEFVEQLARRAQRLMVSLIGEELHAQQPRMPAGRDDLFAKSAATLAELKRRHPRLEIQQLPARPGNWPAMDHIERNVFRHPRDIAAPSPAAVDTLQRIEIVEAAGAQDEVVQLARRIKRRLLDGRDRPDDVVVVFRNLHDAAPRIRAVFAEFGIPFSLEAGVPLAASGLVNTLLRLLRLDAENWPFRHVVAVVTDNLLAAIPRPQRAATEWLVRDLQAVEHREALLSRIERLTSEPSALTPPKNEGTPLSHLDRQVRAARTALPILQQLASALDELPQSATPTDWSAALARLGERLGIETLTTSPTTNALVAENRRAWQHIVDHFASLERLSGWLGEPPPQLARRDVLDALVDIAANDSLPRPHDDVGRVRVLAAATARTVEARHLLLAGMSELAFPSPERDGRLCTEADYAAFARAANQELVEADVLPVHRPQEEMLLFYEIVTRATERLTISYSALDEKAQKLPPSPYITELERTFGNVPIPRRGAPRPSPLPPDDAPLSPADWRIGAVARALGESPEMASLARLFTEPAMNDVAESLEAALRTISERGRRNAFGPAEGLLTSDAVRQRLARRFGKEHLWSPSQFEQYASCPFRFLMDDIFGLEPVGELVLDTDPRRRGNLLHQVLADFHRGHPELFSAGRRSDAEAAEEFVAKFANVVEALTRATHYSGVEAALAHLDRLKVAEWAPKYFEQHANYRDAKWPELDEPLAPTHFEWRFGPPRFEEIDHEDPCSTAEPFVLDLGDEKIRVTGRIDRIDVGRRGEKTVFNVIDYKSGRRPSLVAEKIESGERLQPALYVMAAEALLFGPGRSTPLWAGYWSMAQGTTTDARYSLQCSADGVEPTDTWQSLQKSIVERVREMVTDIRGGQFPVFSRDEHCTSYCDFRTVCRIAQVRSLDKPWPPIE